MNHSLNSNDKLVVAWLQHLRDRRGRQPATLKAYATLAYAWTEHLGDKPMTEASLQDMEKFVARPRAKGTPNGAPATQRRDAAVLRSLYSWLHGLGLVDHNVALGLHTPPVHNVIPKALTDDHWLAWWTSSECEVNENMQIVLGLGFFCGLRREEIVRLRGEQVTPDRIEAFKRKGGGEDSLPWRSMYDVYQTRLDWLVVDPERFPAVLMRRAQHRGSLPLVGWSRPDTVNKTLDQWAREIGAPRFTPHQLRHSCATNLLRAEVPLHMVSSLLNHRSIDTTMRYVRAGTDPLAEWLRGHRGQGHD